MLPTYRRGLVETLRKRVMEPRRFIQAVVGPRQTGKTTSVRQLMELVNRPTHFARAAQSNPQSQDWLRREWEEGRRLADMNRANGGALLIIDEIQMVSQWSSVVKPLWDEDTDNDTELHVIVTGSSALLLTKGLRESLTGRFELLFCEQWDLKECQQAFDYSLDDYLFYGGYPGAVQIRDDMERWIFYMENTIIAPSVMRDTVALDKVNKPAVMEALFSLGAAYSGQEVSYRKLLGQLDDAGNATTIAHYLDLLSKAGLLSGLQKYTGNLIRTRASSPRLIAHDTSLMVVSYGQSRSLLLTDPDRRGHLVESAVGAYLIRRSHREGFDVFWWRDGHNEVDFVLQSGFDITAIEVKSGRVKRTFGLDAFHAAHPGARSIVVGSTASPLERFLLGEVPLF